jgi:hypothetical protein
VPSPHAFTCSGYAIVVPALSAIAWSVCETTVTTAIFAVNAKARATTKAIFFMIVSPLPASLTLPETAIGIRDGHHSLERSYARQLCHVGRNPARLTFREQLYLGLQCSIFKLIIDPNQVAIYRFAIGVCLVEECHMLTKDAASSSAAKLDALPFVIWGQERTEAALSLQKIF